MASFGSIVLGILAFVVIFFIVVIVHELGHFMLARRNGVKVLEFGFGMPPRIWGFKKGGTLYSINMIPIGGFVRTQGQNDFGMSEDDAKDKGNFRNKSLWQRSQIILAGVFMNFLLAFVLLAGGYMYGIPPLVPTTPGYDESIITDGVDVKELSPEGSAYGSGLQIDDRVVAIDQIPLSHNGIFTQYTKDHAGETVTLTVKRGDNTIAIPVAVDAATGRIGVLIANNVLRVEPIRLGPVQAVHAALSDIYHVSAMTLTGLGGMLTKLLTSFQLSEDLTGPAGIVGVTYSAVQMGFVYLLQLTIFLSITLGIMNVLPFPGLDGGHFALILVEKIRGKRLNPALESRIHLLGFVLLIALMIAVTINDVQKLAG